MTVKEYQLYQERELQHLKSSKVRKRSSEEGHSDGGSRAAKKAKKAKKSSRKEADSDALDGTGSD